MTLLEHNGRRVVVQAETATADTMDTLQAMLGFSRSRTPRRRTCGSGSGPAQGRVWSLVRRAMDLVWTRDPFDRFLAAHRLVRRVPLCAVDQVIVEHHGLLPEELVPG